MLRVRHVDTEDIEALFADHGLGNVDRRMLKFSLHAIVVDLCMLLILAT